MIARLVFFLTLLCCLANPAAAKEFSYEAFSRIPVQHEGRIKPMDTFARHYLYALSGKDSIDGMTADAWLAETLFDPAGALQRPVFRIFRPELLALPEGRRYYSYAELAPALMAKGVAIAGLLQQDPKEWSEDQAEIMRLHELSILYAQLLRSFSYALPLNVSVPPTLAKKWAVDPAKPFTLEQYRKIAAKLDEAVKAIVKKKGQKLKSYTAEEKEIAWFAFEMKRMEQSGQDNILLRIVPGQWEGASEEWFAPWAIAQSGQGSPSCAGYMALWSQLALSYAQGDADAWQSLSGEILAKSRGFAPEERLNAEIIYNGWHILNVVLGLYLLSFLLYLASAMRGGQGWRIAAITALGAGCAVHVAAIALRIYILERPPVGTLYESILFVAAVCTIASLVLEMARKDGIGLLSGALSGLLLLFVAESFGGDDTMKMLVAVLNTNFWLATHVLCITMGYGWALLASLLAHMWLVRTAAGKDSPTLVPAVKSVALIALLFTAVGTILGGIWADQSWGRFWGWDPKENGALLIVLWLIWILHGQISGHLKRLSAMAAMAALSMVVALAWFGVNLLNVGLHSYGFVSGVAAGLFAFVAFETLVIGGLCYCIAKRRRA